MKRPHHTLQYTNTVFIVALLLKGNIMQNDGHYLNFITKRKYFIFQRYFRIVNVTQAAW